MLPLQGIWKKNVFIVPCLDLQTDLQLSVSCRDMARQLAAMMLLCGLCMAASVELVDKHETMQAGAAAAVVAVEAPADGGDRGAVEDSEASPEYFVLEDDLPEALPPLEEEHAYFASLDLDSGMCPYRCAWRVYIAREPAPVAGHFGNEFPYSAAGL